MIVKIVVTNYGQRLWLAVVCNYGLQRLDRDRSYRSYKLRSTSMLSQL